MKIVRVFPILQSQFFYTEHYLAKELQKDGHETIFISSDRYLSSWGKYLKEFQSSGKYDYYKIIRLRSIFPQEKSIFIDVRGLWRILFRGGFDILHLYGLGTFTTIIVNSKENK